MFFPLPTAAISNEDCTILERPPNVSYIGAPTPRMAVVTFTADYCGFYRLKSVEARLTSA